ncbi:unnamed protein product [Brassica oleracea]|uniref:Protein RER1 n=1 Tax=Brassica napus TaxID=3708 RepID=A0A816NF17_BRANA|nr:unnamed protein product [Brassica napus]
MLVMCSYCFCARGLEDIPALPRQDYSSSHLPVDCYATLVVALAFSLRVFYIQGFYIIAYGLGIYLLNLLIGFLSPLVDPEAADGPSLPTRGSDEFKPFIRRLPEFKFWYFFYPFLIKWYRNAFSCLNLLLSLSLSRYSMTKAFCIAFVMTFFSLFDVPVFWPILLFVLTMRRQISHMIKYKYIPFSFGKQKYGGRSSSTSSGSRAE